MASSLLPVVDEVLALDKFGSDGCFGFGEPGNLLRNWYRIGLEKEPSSRTKLSHRRLRWLVVTRPAIVRSGAELCSDEVKRLEKDDEVVGSKLTLSRCGTTRVELDMGWVSWKCVRPRDWMGALRATGRCRWCVDLASWRPLLGESGDEWAILLDLVAELPERERVVAYHRWLDRARALAGRLLARRCCQLALGLSHDDIRIDRTKGGKPFLKSPRDPRREEKPSFPNFNFNVSHDGRYVVVASEPHCIVGIDVAAPERLRRAVARDGSAPPRAKRVTSSKDMVELDRACKDLAARKDDDESSETMNAQLSERERSWVEAAGKRERATRFRCVWAAKEAVTKARGDGLGCKFESIDVDLHFDDQRTFRAEEIRIRGSRLRQWTLTGQLLDSGHVVAVARAPPSDVVDAHGIFSATLKQKVLEDSRFAEAEPDFVFLEFRDLVPPDRIDAYRRAVAADQKRLETRRNKLRRVSASENDLSKNHALPSVVQRGTDKTFAKKSTTSPTTVVQKCFSAAEPSTMQARSPTSVIRSSSTDSFLNRPPRRHSAAGKTPLVKAHTTSRLHSPPEDDEDDETVGAPIFG